MKKTKQVYTYYCDYCSKECEHTPLYVVPKLESVTEYKKNSIGVKLCCFQTRKLTTKQVDVCPECQKKMALLLELTPRVDFANDNPNTVSITF